MNDSILIRKATTGDLAILYQFEQGVITAELPFDSTLKDELINYYDLPQMISATHIELLVGEFDGSIIASGYARIEQAKPYLKHTAYAYLGFMYVLPAYRGKGINKKIVQALQQWAVTQNVFELRLDVYYGNEPAIKAYEKIGFSKHMIEMRLEAEKNDSVLI